MNLKKSLLLLVVAAVVAGVVLSGGCKKDEPVSKTPDVDVLEKVVAEYVNTTCPMMGSVIKPENVTEDLTREFKGQKVAFCCAGCPTEWDKLSDEEKDAKLLAAK